MLIGTEYDSESHFNTGYLGEDQGRRGISGRAYSRSITLLADGEGHNRGTTAQTNDSRDWSVAKPVPQDMTALHRGAVLW